MMILKLSEERFNIIKRFVKLSCGHQSPEIRAINTPLSKIEVIVYFSTGRHIINEYFNIASINKLIKVLKDLKLEYTHEKKQDSWIGNYSIITFHIDFKLVDKIGKLI